MRVAGVLMLVSVASARADDVDTTRLGKRFAPQNAPDPVLELDPIFRPNIEGLGTTEVHHRNTFDLGASTRIAFDAIERSNELDIVSRGWRMDARLHRDLGFALLSVGVSVEDIQTRYTSGRYLDAGVALTKTFAWARGIAWISLGVGVRRWQGAEPPPGEHNSKQVTLSAGTTF